MRKTELNATDGGEININGHFGGESVEDKTIHQNDNSWQSEFARLGQKCDATERELRGKIDNLYEQRINDMRKVISALVIGGFLMCLLIFQMFFVSNNDVIGNQAVTAIDADQLYDLAQRDHPVPPEFAMTLTQRTGEHCIIEGNANETDVSDGINKDDCFETIELATAELSNRTGDDLNRLLLARNDPNMITAVIGVHYANSYYGGSSVTIYAGSDSGCYGGRQWYLPVVNWAVNSAITLGGCHQTTLYAQHYFQGWQFICGSCPTVGGQVKSAKYN